MLFFLILGIACIITGLFNIMLAVMSMNPKNLITVPGELVAKDYRVNNYTRFRETTKYTYTYRVKNKTYKISYVESTHLGNFRNQSQIVYLRGFPWIASIEKFYSDRYWLFGIEFVLIGIFGFWFYSS
ncbi:MAG: hypothetical protein IJO22_03660 [Oscillospiraceae bacterium]|nr:hypothetical protein [Oscillospiraceae bacterium]